jgi:signal transduction histidine kinase/DNA-binding response OmpR family regulator
VVNTAQQTDGPARGPRDSRVGQDLTRLLYEQAPIGLALTVVNAFLVTVAISLTSLGASLWSWFGAVVALVLARQWLVIRYRRDPGACSDRLWARLFALGTTLTGAAWGASALLLPPEGVIHQLFLAFVIAGMVAGAIPSLSSYLPAYVGYMLLALLPLAERVALMGGYLSQTLLVMILLFSLFLVSSARRYHQTLIRSLELGYANADLVASLTREKERIGALNADLRREVAERRAIGRALVLAKEEAEAASQAKSRFVANMSHEIRTPMNGLLGMLEMLAQTRLDREQREALQVVRSSAEGLLTVINDILDVSKIEAGKLELESIPFDVHALAEELATLFSASARSKGLELACFVAPGTPAHVVGDPTRLRQILSNLLGNAIKFTDAGEVVLRLEEAEPASPDADRVRLRFEVIDTGIGLSAAQMTHLFRPFHQADASTTRRFGGSGLGLAISRNLARLMAGDIEVASEPGRGSRFALVVPFARQQAPEAAAGAGDLAGRHALIVDDNETNRRVVGYYLRGWGIAADCAATAAEGLARLRAAAAEGRPFDVAILDLEMPDVDGLGLAGQIRADATLAATPILLLSSGGQVVGREAIEPVLVLSKPVRQQLLRDGLVEVLSGATPGPPAVPTAPETATLRGRVLLVEDNPINRRVALGLLARLGLGADVADTGAHGIARATGADYDVILMDIQMPDLDGYETTRAIRRWEAARGRRPVPIVAMTANTLEGDRERCLEAGMDDYVAKPVRLAALAEVLGHWLGAATRST